MNIDKLSLSNIINYIEINNCNVSVINRLQIKNYFPKLKNDKINELKMDDISKYSITLPKIAEYITNVIKSYFNIHDKVTITDATSSVGGNTVSFCKNFYFVNAVEIENNRAEMLNNNLNLFECNNYKIYNTDYTKIMNNLVQDVIFIDPPWGGLEYKNKNNIKLLLGSYSIEDICIIINNNNLAKLTVLKLPYNYDINFFKEKIKFTFVINKIKSILLVIIINNKYFYN